MKLLLLPSTEKVHFLINNVGFGMFRTSIPTDDTSNKLAYTVSLRKKPGHGAALN